MMLGQGGFRGFVSYDFEAENEDGLEKPWRLLVLEDTGELLSADARDRAGQGLSRFLNVVDGLIGQGLRVLVLVTTNERSESSIPRSPVPVAAPRTSSSAHWERTRPRAGASSTGWKGR